MFENAFDVEIKTAFEIAHSTKSRYIFTLHDSMCDDDGVLEAPERELQTRDIEWSYPFRLYKMSMQSIFSIKSMALNERKCKQFVIR